MNIDTSKFNLLRADGAVNSAESRMIWIGAILVALFGGAFYLHEQVLKCSTFPTIGHSLFFLLLSMLLLSCGVLVSVTMPRLKTTSKKKSLFYFNEIAQLPTETFHQMMHSLTDDQTEEHLNLQTHATSKVAIKKFRAVRYSLLFLICGLILLVTYGIIFYGYC